jgi:hypothetical protein
MRPTASSHPPDVGTLWLCAFAVATPLGCSTVALVYFGMWTVGKPLSFGSALIAGLPDWYVWALLTPIVFWLGQHFRLERQRWLVAALVHLVCGTIIALLDLWAVTVINRALGPTVSFVGPNFWDIYLRIVLRYYHSALIIYWVIVAAAHSWRHSRCSSSRISSSIPSTLSPRW